MSRIPCVPLLCVALAFVPPATTVGAQRSPSPVTLVATVRPYATIERLTPPVEHRRADNSTEYQVTLTVRANSSYRVVARRRGPGARAITLGVSGTVTSLAADRSAVQIARGTAGVTTFDIAFAAEDGGAGPDVAAAIRLDVLPKPEP